MASRVLLVCALALAASAADWNYAKGGTDWPGACAAPGGSPVHIDEVKESVDSKELDLYYPVVNAWGEGMKVRHRGDAIVVPAVGDGLGYAYHEGHKYYVRELVFRAPSEHKIKGERFPLEMQIVHRRKDDVLGEHTFVVSTVYRMVQNSTRASSRFLNRHLNWNALPSYGKRTMLTKAFQLGRGVQGLHGGYYRYVGSTTTPPCSGAVWSVLETVQEVTPQQLFRINHLFKGNYSFAQGRGNNRKIQPLNGRTVVLHNHKAQGDGDGLETRPAALRNDMAASAPVVQPEDLSFVNNAPTGKRPATLPKQYRLQGADWTEPLCHEGTQQSPIDIQLAQGSPHGDWEMSLAYTPSNATNGLEHDGNTFVLRGEFGSIKVGTDRLEATELRFHSPAEHTVDGRRAAMELEIIHKSNSGLTAIVSVLFHESSLEQSAFLDSLSWHLLPYKKGQRVILEDPVNLSLLKGLRKGYYSYAGSLSQPPCTEGVMRFVMRTINEISEWQLRQYRNRFFGNIRSIQKSNDRGVALHRVNSASEIVPKFRNQPPVKVTTAA